MGIELRSAQLERMLAAAAAESCLGTGSPIMDVVGLSVSFWEWDKKGEEVLVTGVVEHEFAEPLEEDRLQRLNYRVRTADDRVFTPYASECQILRGIPRVEPKHRG